MKRDGRTLDHKTLEEIRVMAVRCVLEGERPSVVIASYGFARPVIYRWLRDVRGKGRGLRALRSRKGTGRPRRLAPKQEQQLFRWINGKDPRQHGFDFGLDAAGSAQVDCGQVRGQLGRDGCRQASGEVGIDAAEAVEARLRA